MRVEPQAVAGQQHHGESVFPLVLVAEGPMSQQDLHEHLVTLMEQLATHGAILFRGCGVTDAQAFDAFVAGFGLPNFAYHESLSNAVRHNRTPRVFTANEAPQDVEIFLHHEMAQTPYYPCHLFFFCEQAAVAGGATPLCRSDVRREKLTQHLPEVAGERRVEAEHSDKLAESLPVRDRVDLELRRHQTLHGDRARQRVASDGSRWPAKIPSRTSLVPDSVISDFAGARSFFSK